MVLDALPVEFTLRHANQAAAIPHPSQRIYTITPIETVAGLRENERVECRALHRHFGSQALEKKLGLEKQ
ncbi:hypothetical protein QTI66_37610 [Variovorax sp. J22R133]|uniref:hypothetical protein n=1 Tax=Variovorax brevis TaxID=3053503 RepID=UPI002575F863|nr:hypothetical protein [Variovorax sp. J22R133]MDM0117816.1 hypothetical protein [Variovorax sp. J22R133]